MKRAISVLLAVLLCLTGCTAEEKMAYRQISQEEAKSMMIRDDEQTDTEPGDIVLYAGNQIVVFYGNNSWAYTRLGHIDLTRQEMDELLGHGTVTLTISAGAE